MLSSWPTYINIYNLSFTYFTHTYTHGVAHFVCVWWCRCSRINVAHTIAYVFGGGGGVALSYHCRLWRDDARTRHPHIRQPTPMNMKREPARYMRWIHIYIYIVKSVLAYIYIHTRLYSKGECYTVQHKYILFPWAICCIYGGGAARRRRRLRRHLRQNTPNEKAPSRKARTSSRVKRFTSTSTHTFTREYLASICIHTTHMCEFSANLNIFLLKEGNIDKFKYFKYELNIFM